MRFQDLGTRGVLQNISPLMIQEAPGWNVRQEGPELDAHIRALADSIREVGVLEPLTVYLEGERVFLTNGHCRLAAIKLLLAEGVEIFQVPVRTEPKLANDADRTASLITRNSGKPLAPMEAAEVLRRLMAYGLKPKEVAAKVGYSVGRVTELLGLASAPQEIKAMVGAKQVSASTAARVVRERKADAPAVLREAVARAAEQGKTKATDRHLKPAPVVDPFEAFFERWQIDNRISSEQYLAELRPHMKDAFEAGRASR